MNLMPMATAEIPDISKATTDITKTTEDIILKGTKKKDPAAGTLTKETPELITTERERPDKEVSFTTGPPELPVIMSGILR